MKFKWFFPLIMLFLSSCNSEISLSNIEPTGNAPIESKPTEAKSSLVSLPTLAVNEITNSKSDFTGVVVNFLGSDEYVNLRSGPGTLYPIIATHPTSQPVEALAINSTGEWVMLAYPDSETQKAWVYSALIALEGVNLPVVDTQSMELMNNNLPIPTQVAPSLNVLINSIQIPAELVQYIEQETHINHPAFPRIDVFSYQNVKYSVDPEVGLVVLIDASLAYLPLPNPEELPLEQLAILFIEELAPTVDLNNLTQNHGEKGGIYFYRWEGTDLGFIYVGLTEFGELVTYVNAVY